ncbi:MAG: hypothetical protein HY648_08970 [Acidobacteria bacterium]|nr:hypothetical protein [Acidobacteriota bacterium]
MPRKHLTSSLVLPLWIVLGMNSSAWAQGSAPTTSQGRQGAVQAAAKLEELERRLGPLEVKGQRFTVVLHKKRIAGSTDADFGETLSRIEIRDQGGAVQYQREFPSEVEEDRFQEAWDASAQVLEGKQGTGLLITYGVLPSTPLGGESWQVFGLFNGKLVAFSPPVFVEGQLINQQAGGEVLKTSEEPNLQGEVLHFRIWTGNLFVIVPLRVDWLQAKLAPAWRCSKMTLRGPQPLCRLRVETDRVSQQDDLTFVRLHPEPEEELGVPAHVVVKKDSKVEFLEAEAEVLWDEDTEGVGLAVSPDLWLKVRIDGKEGWIHTQEDLQAIGLPQAG